MGQFCCMRLSLTTKIIGTFGLSTSILMINVVLSEFFSRESNDQFLISVESWTILGTNWINIMKKAHFIHEATTVLACVLIYAFLSLLVNALLILGSNVKQPKYFMPWMYMNLFIIFDQTTAITLHLSHLLYNDIYLRSPWYMRISSIFLIMCIYFWTIVYTNKRDGFVEPVPPLVYVEQPCTTIVTITTDSNMPKSPSFLSGIAHSPFVYTAKIEPNYETTTELPHYPGKS